MEEPIYEAVLRLYGLPTAYAKASYDRLAVSAARVKELQQKVEAAPMAGTLTIKGDAGPVVNQLIKLGRTVRGIDFLDRMGDVFEKEGRHHNPSAQVIVLYNVGAEVSLNNKISNMVFNTILKQYAGQNTLFIIETALSKNDLLSRYDFSVTNFVQLQRSPEDLWI